MTTEEGGFGIELDSISQYISVGIVEPANLEHESLIRVGKLILLGILLISFQVLKVEGEDRVQRAAIYDNRISDVLLKGKEKLRDITKSVNKLVNELDSTGLRS